ncbi:two-component system response regulator KdpE [Ferrovum myxofaciens]|jgi:two-component system KDP operon response regulator KdpE|uniref:KDP operon transcriptional regulatory protein KdpE n=3 Tax=root TaxID=1 RepID=A0A8F3DTL9_9PROT|nr:two-component system response regulator KdpE [Ferrovum myxofaciens]KXW57905.1 KDP operon transcriptional regulatory protein KdpE [Ferrovum myxofaciens]MBU6993549.1 two-component system response regulator KdpE [Ferrovum myxofaciens]QKE37480.1 MAG: two-component system response regulator KdpE [Ferrovum myxofaciens]QKE40046.1 MAG: two-component system response regulator KdpE [Ferrovum myxofaciens]QWY75129.1 MAG: two-component system response regulator KdpE [Ferrovum myxofaciens]
MSETVVILVEDEKQIRRFVRAALESEGCQVIEAVTGERGLIEAATRKPDLVILDLGLPDREGVEVLQDLRSWSQVPVIILSARSNEEDKIAALDAGADDYLTKPFGVGELLARVRAQLRRHSLSGEAGQSEIGFGKIRVDRVKRLVMTEEGESIHLTSIEYRLLAYLLAYPGKVLTHRELLREVWGPTHVESAHYLRVYMGNLRKKLERDPARPDFLLTESGLGYRFKP